MAAGCCMTHGNACFHSQTVVSSQSCHCLRPSKAAVFQCLFGTSDPIARLCRYEAIAANAASSDHKPCSELVTRSKLSCLAWNAGDAAQLISSDYEGVVTLWDAEAGNALSEYEAHERRIWSIDFCKTDPRLFASGSDDGCVKVRCWACSMLVLAAFTHLL